MSDHRVKNHDKLKIPPRWLHCPRKGNPVAGKFVPFKTPLDEFYDDQVPEESRFPPSMLINFLHSSKLNIGLWIDLTNTNRFYDKSHVERAGIKYLKLACRGHSECPSDDVTESFIKICSSFISKNPLEVIGVHCTHGFNRTGYLITSYMVEKDSWSIEAAIAEFTKSRAPGIYKADYLHALFKRYSDITEVPNPPELPGWCTESDDSVDDDGNSISGSRGDTFNATEFRKYRRKEINKKNPTFMEGVPGVMPISTQPKLLQIQRKAQEMCKWQSSGFPGSQPVSMDCQNIILLSKKPYQVSWKADGNRYLMLIDGENEVYFLDRDNAVFQVANLTFPKRKEPDKHLSGTLLDGEMIIDHVDGHRVPRYLVYDIVVFEGMEVGGTEFNRRRLCIKKEIVDTRNTAMAEGRIDRSKEPFSVRAKDFWDIMMAKNILGEKFQKNVVHEVDGLIFQPAKDPYICGQNLEVLKWKPPHLNSVDFKLVIAREQRPGMLPETNGYLYVGGLDQPFGMIKVTKELKSLDKKIIECKFVEGMWKFMRERTDKSFPNSYKTAVAVCQSIQVPVTQEKLLLYIEKDRFIPPKEEIKRPADGQQIPDAKRAVPGPT